MSRFHRAAGVGGVDGRAALIPVAHALLARDRCARVCVVEPRVDGRWAQVRRDVTCIVLRV